MSWIQKLYETYEQCKGHEPPGAARLMPISHTPQQAHIEITLDDAGNFKGAKIVRKEETIIPATEESAGRSGSACAPHALCDKIYYCGKDYPKFGGKKLFGGKKKAFSFLKEYENQLSAWCESSFSHTKAKAVLAYIRRESLVADLVREQILHLGVDGKLLTQWNNEAGTPDIFRLLTANDGERDQGDAFIRWQVREGDNPCSAVWEDISLQDAWGAFDASMKELKGVCVVTGDMNALLTTSHPKRIRHAGDGAKLISANDSSGYTFRGRFTDDTGQQACGVSYAVTQKAHNALRWLIGRQAYRSGDFVVVSWSIAGKPLPDPFKDSLSLILDTEETATETAPTEQSNIGDVGQAFAIRLRKAIAGYGAKLSPTDDIVVMGLDSATPGRMAITFYRELKGSDFLSLVQQWHERYAWHQNFGKDKHFDGAPAPRDIAEAAFATRIGDGGELRIDEKLLKTTVERILPCIVDGQDLPRDLVQSAFRRACNRIGMKHWEWEKRLGIACALFRGSNKERKYQMALETERTSRDYLYGRLLAIAESIEGFALTKAEQNRETTAARLMQRFSDRPYSTWRNIELALTPYKARLRTSEKGAGFLFKREKLLDEVLCAFLPNDFTNDKPLTGEFLLGYHCQRQALRPTKPDESAPETEAQNTDN